MCLEVYSSEQPIQLPFASETIRFLNPHQFRVRYIVLVRNAGYRPIEVLSVLFPRPLFSFPARSNPSSPSFRLAIPGLVDITHSLPEVPGYFFEGPVGGRLRARLADPNNPVCDLPYLEGVWNPGNASIGIPEGLARRRCFEILHQHGYTAWVVRLGQAIAPGDAHWFCWELVVADAGESLDGTPIGSLVFHSVSSPLDVRRTIIERLHGNLRDIHEHPRNPVADREHEAVIRILLHGLWLHQERQVDIQYYELSVQPGNPQWQYLVNHTHEGDIRLRSGSPRIGRDDLAEDREFRGEPVYEWKSGSILEPAHPWRNLGFSLRFTLAWVQPPEQPPAPRKRKGAKRKGSRSS